MTHALGEITAIARRAARGRGASWAVADEVAGAARWLCAYGLDGCAVTARWLLQTDGLPERALAPVSLSDWRGANGQLCGVMSGLSLLDRAAVCDGITLHDVIEPAFVLPFLSGLAQINEQAVAASGDGYSAIADAQALQIVGDMPAFAARITLRNTSPLPLQPKQTRVKPRPHDWLVLCDFAARTYAPATDASRLRGAGAGLNDND